MNNLIFTSEDFQGCKFLDTAARAAQVKYNNWLRGQRDIWLQELDKYGNYKLMPSIYEATHVAKLINIELIKKPECKHEAVAGGEYSFHCQSCGKELKPKGWEEA